MTALLAGVGIGIWPDIATATSQVIRETATTLPQRDESEVLANLRAVVREQIA